MKPRDYEEAWLTLKGILLAQYDVGNRRVKGKRWEKNKSRVQKYNYTLASLDQLKRILETMDKLDGTHEFSNLKHDLERGSE